MNVNGQTQTLYTRRASFYEKFFVNFIGWGRQLETFFRRSGYLHSNLKILDAGCGTGIVTRILYKLANENHYDGIKFHAFDLNKNMLEVFQRLIVSQSANIIELRQADVLQIEELPSDWNKYDLIVSSTMFEYLPKYQVSDALSNLKQLLNKEGTLLVFITRRNIITQLLAAKWWRANLFEESEIKSLFHDAGFNRIVFKNFPRWWSNSIMVIEGKINQ